MLQKWTSNNPQRDQDHCEFCGAKFMAEESPETLSVGDAAGAHYRWFCPQCFGDFKELLEWHPADN